MTNYRRGRRRINANPTLPRLVDFKPPVRQETPTYYPKAVFTKRECLSCEKDFKSEGIHHRICDRCKSDENWRFEGEC